MERDSYRGIIHFHSCHSYDSNTSIEQILNHARNLNLDFLLLTDHNTTEGALRLRQMVKRDGIDIEVPICAEYSTEFGDIIGAFLSENIFFKSYRDLIEQIKVQKGLILLPHPFYKHENLNELVNDADLVEVLNPFLQKELNMKALDISRNYEKKHYYGSDSHLAGSLGNVIVTVEKRGDLKTSLLEGRIEYKIIGQVNPFEKVYTQIIKAKKRRDFRLLFLSLLKLLKLFIFRLFKR